MKSDIYQKRYLAHQQKKRKSLTPQTRKLNRYTKKERDIFFKVLENRRSQRIFTNEETDIKRLLDAINIAPSSCDRKGAYVKVITERKDKEILSGLLVGGVGWSYRGDKILLIVANQMAYKSPAEKVMPYLDAGVIVQTAYLACEVMELGCCYVNPNIREENKEFFENRFLDKGEIFCGALIIGKYGN